MSETRAPYRVPALMQTEPSLEIFIQVSEVLLLKTSVAEVCAQLGENLHEMDGADFDRIEWLYKRMQEWRNASVRELPLFKVMETE